MSTETSATLTARFNPLVRPYLVVIGALILASTLVGLPLALIWVLGVGQWWARHYFDRLLCEVDDDELRFRKGIIFTVEKTIPLENIQDVTFIEGPLLRHFHLSTLKFETAGQSVGQAHHMQLTGIIDAHEFRAAIMARRQRARLRTGIAGALPPGDDAQSQLVLLREISAKMDRVIEALQTRDR